MRGSGVRTESLFSYGSYEQRPQGHPLRRVVPVVDAVLADLSGEFAKLYAPIGRPSIPPGRLLRALLLQAFYSVRAERQLIKQLEYNLLFRWFTGLAIDDPVWDVTVFTKNLDRLLAGDIAKFFEAVLSQPQIITALLADEHFKVDGTLIEAEASTKSFKPKAEGGDQPPASGAGEDGRYVVSQRLRPRIAASFGGIKAVGGLRKTRHPRHRAGGPAVYLTAAACNPIRLPSAGGRLIMPDLRPQRSTAGPDGGPGFSKARFPTFKEENRTAYHLTSAAC
ncbi:MAG: transposase [Thermomicrobiales bacterium]|nr:transposase [Thermomicrobiales bacterium]